MVPGAEQPPDCAAPPDTARAPRLRLPDGAWDTHIHVFGDPERHPLAPGRSYTPHVCPLARYGPLMQALGIARAVLVQPSVYGTDNSAMLEALAQAGPGWRGVAVPSADIADDALYRMHALGVRGFRLNLVNPAVLSIAAAEALSRRVAPLGWHLDLQVDLSSTEGERQLAACDGLGLPVVVDHFGRADAPAALGPLLSRLEQGRCWVKLSAPYRLRAGSASLRAMVRAVLSAGPARVLWGSDWPHTELAHTVQAADWLDMLEECLDGQSAREAVFVGNPAALYGQR